MLSLEEATRRILEQLSPPVCEPVPLQLAVGRVCLEQICAATALPPFDNSAMDGYAVRADDVGQAGTDHPATLKLVGEVAAGSSFQGTIEPGQCVRIFTGSPLPQGADAVVMQEDTRCPGNEPAAVQVLDRVGPWENVRLTGEDVKAGAVIAEPGNRLDVSLISLLAATGVAQVQVSRQPVIGLLATGDELCEPGQPQEPGQIYESNRLTLAALVEQAGARAKLYPLVPDQLEATSRALTQAFAECDAVITSGGASVGAHDYVKDAFPALGGTLDFWKVAIKPGKPFVFGSLNGKPLFGLPGNPVSAFVTFLVLVRPALLRLQGDRAPALPQWPGELQAPLVNPGDRRHFMRVIQDAEGGVKPAGLQASHALGSLAAANGLVDVPPESALPTGSRVNVIRWS